jgi:DeoR/GlpR family transcriptional regulator of sugar metabolism
VTQADSAAACTGDGRPPLVEARRQMVNEMLVQAGAVTLTELQARFGVSQTTVRRDLSVLEGRGQARRTRGGAILPSTAVPDHSFARRLRNAQDAKVRLAEQAYALISPGETVFLDASTTTFVLARLIRQRKLPLRVVTNSLPALSELADAEAEVIAIGGTFRRFTHSCVGPAAVRAVRDLFADRFVLTVTGVTASGMLTDADGLEAEVKRTMLAQAERSVLLLDESKLDARALNVVAHLREISAVFADGIDVAQMLEQAS